MAAPKLAETLVEGLLLSVRQRSWWGMIPWLLLTLVCGPCLLIWLNPDCLRQRLLQSQYLHGLAAALLVVSGLLIAVCVNVTRETYSLVSSRDFAGYLKHLGTFDLYLAMPSLTLLFQILYVFLSIATTAVHAVYGMPPWLPYLLAVNIGYFIYVLVKTWNLVDMMRVLAWHRQDFLEELDKATRK